MQAGVFNIEQDIRFPAIIQRPFVCEPEDEGQYSNDQPGESGKYLFPKQFSFFIPDRFHKQEKGDRKGHGDHIGAQHQDPAGTKTGGKTFPQGKLLFAHRCIIQPQQGKENERERIGLCIISASIGECNTAGTDTERKTGNHGRPSLLQPAPDSPEDGDPHKVLWKKDPIFPHKVRKIIDPVEKRSFMIHGIDIRHTAFVHDLSNPSKYRAVILMAPTAHRQQTGDHDRGKCQPPCPAHLFCE